MNWPQTLIQLVDADEAFVIITVASTRGSTPRETGAKMFVTPTRTIGTIGGGQLEYECTAVACQWFHKTGAAQTFSRRFTLGVDCGQCCGGVAEVLFEQIMPQEASWTNTLRQVTQDYIPAMLVTVGDSRTGVTKRVITNQTAYEPDDTMATMAVERLAANAPASRDTIAMPGNLELPVLFEPLQTARFEIVLFGAGHVGSALISSLAALPCHVTWVDSRPGIFPVTVPANVYVAQAAEPENLVDRFDRGCYFLVMSHSHAIDLQICAKILARADFAYCGLIGSRSKRRQFEKRLGGLGLSAKQLQRLTCPIGIEGISGKKPPEIAIAVTAQLLQLREAEIASQKPVTKPVQRQHRL